MIRLNVFLRFDEKNRIPVGQLAEDNHRLYFQYDTNFLTNNLWLSPYKLPLKPELFAHRDREFGPLFGLFDDSLPDGWGRLLMDRFLGSKGYDIHGLSELDRLSFLGENTMGALTYEPTLDLHIKDSSPFDLHKLAQKSHDILTGNTEKVLPQLMKAGGSPGGARPKVLVGISGNTLISGETDLPEDYEHWIVKFNTHSDFDDAGQVEYIYSLMARDAGLEMAETRLFDTLGEDPFFGTQRFDRKGNRRFHVHTFGNMIHSNFRVPSQDYDHLFRLVANLTRNHQDLIRAFRQMVFNIFANNRDDHVKNFSFIMSDKGEWSLALAYDLTYSPGPGGEHSMTVAGEGKTPSRKNINQLGERHGIKKNVVEGIIEQAGDAVKRFPDYAKDAGISSAVRKKIYAAIKRNMDGC